MATDDASQRDNRAANLKSLVLILASFISVGVVWTYLYFGGSGAKWWAYGIVGLLVPIALFYAWRSKRLRDQTQLQNMQRWAEKNETRRRRPVS